MTHPRSATEPQGVRTHVVVGERGEVGSALARAHRDGRLAGARNLVELPAGRVQITVDLREPARTRRRWPWLVLVWALGAAVAAGIVWLLIVAVSALVTVVTTAVAWVSGHLPLILIVAVGLVLLLAVPAGSRCAGSHCGGCRR